MTTKLIDSKAPPAVTDGVVSPEGMTYDSIGRKSNEQNEMHDESCRDVVILKATPAGLFNVQRMIRMEYFHPFDLSSLQDLQAQYLKNVTNDYYQVNGSTSGNRQ